MGAQRERGGLASENGQVWKPPPIGTYSQRLLEEGLLLKNEALRNAKKGAPWKEWDTPLYRYCAPLATRDGTAMFDRYLEKLAFGNGRFVVVDVGFGSGRQWLGFLREHRQIDFWGTALLADRVAPSMRKRAVVCSAGAVDRVFPEGFADFLASRFGFHREADLFPAAIAKVLKENGEAVVTALEGEIRIFMRSALKAGLEILRVGESPGNSPEISVHLRKMA